MTTYWWVEVCVAGGRSLLLHAGNDEALAGRLAAALRDALRLPPVAAGRP